MLRTQEDGYIQLLLPRNEQADEFLDYCRLSLKLPVALMKNPFLTGAFLWLGIPINV